MRRQVDFRPNFTKKENQIQGAKEYDQSVIYENCHNSQTQSYTWQPLRKNPSEKHKTGQIPLRLRTGDGAGSVYTSPTEPGPFAEQHAILRLHNSYGGERDF